MKAKATLSLFLSVFLLAGFLEGFRPARTMQPASATAESGEFLISGGTLKEYFGTGKSVTIPDGVKSIGVGAFESCKTLESVIIPSSVTVIGEQAFEGCSNLKEIGWPDNSLDVGRDAFTGTRWLREYSGNFVVVGDGVLLAYKGSGGKVTIPDNVSGISDYAFYHLAKITSVTIPDGVTAIGDDAFYGCTRLASVKMADSVRSIGKQAFYGCRSLSDITIPDKVSLIGGAALGETKWEKNYSGDFVTANGILFDYKGNSTEISIPGGVKTVTEFVPAELANLTTVNVPASVLRITLDAFADSDSLENINVDAGNPNYSSENGVLYNKSKTRLLRFPAGSELETLNIPDSLTAVENSAFQGNYNLMAITAGSGNANFTSKGGVLFNKNMTELVRFPANAPQKSYTVPGTVRRIDREAFLSNQNLKKVVLPAGLTEIGYSAFENCSLENVNLPGSIVKIGAYAFSGSNITSVSLPAKISYLGDAAFSSCRFLRSAVIPAAVSALPPLAFFQCENLTKVTFSGSLRQISYLAFSGIEVQKLRLPAGVVFIGRQAFYQCGAAGIEIPASVVNIGPEAFAECSRNKAFSVDSGNAGYVSVGGVLFRKDRTQLIQYPLKKAAKFYTVPAGVTSVGPGAFRGAADLQGVRVFKAAASIGDTVFGYCRAQFTVFCVPGTAAWKYANANHVLCSRPVASVTLFKKPDVTTVSKGSKLSLAGAKIRVVLVNGAKSILDVVPVMVSGFHPDKTGTQKVKITYGGKKVTVSVKVV